MEEDSKMAGPVTLDLARGKSGLKRRNAHDPNDLPLSAQIIAIDPGGTTGWTLMSVHPDSLDPGCPNIGILSNIEMFVHGQVDCGSLKGNLGTGRTKGVSTSGESAGVNELLGLIRSWPGAAVLIEDFVLRQMNQSRDLLSPVRITSVIDHWLWTNGRAEAFKQQPSEAKSTATDQRLKAWGLYSSEGGLQHARDADRHAITFFRKASMPGKAGQELREAAWPHLYGPGRPYAITKPLGENRI